MLAVFKWGIIPSLLYMNVGHLHHHRRNHRISPYLESAQLGALWPVVSIVPFGTTTSLRKAPIANYRHK